MKRIIGNRLSHSSRFLVRCNQCGRNTSTKYAREHGGLCKPCVEPAAAPTREERILEHGFAAYAREEGHYDEGGDR